MRPCGIVVESKKDCIGVNWFVKPTAPGHTKYSGMWHIVQVECHLGTMRKSVVYFFSVFAYPITLILGGYFNIFQDFDQFQATRWKMLAHSDSQHNIHLQRRQCDLFDWQCVRSSNHPGKVLKLGANQIMPKQSRAWHMWMDQTPCGTPHGDTWAIHNSNNSRTNHSLASTLCRCFHLLR